MNKTVNINLAGIFFHIDEDAYIKLQRYLEAIKRSFTDSQGRSEIIADIEARIAELFAERMKHDKQVIGTKEVEEVIAIMGQPEDYLVDDEIFEDQPKQQTTRSASKKLFRDTDNSYIGGVASGLSHYLGIDAIWVRLIWLLFAIGSGGTFILIYILFWVLVPEAITTSDKLTMTGEPVNISNIEKKIKDGFENVSQTVSDTVKNVDFQKHGNKIKSSSKSFFDTIGDVIMFFFKVFAKFIGIILMLVGAGTLIALIVTLFSFGLADAVQIPGIDYLNAANVANVPVWLMSLLVFFAIGIPFFFIFYLGLKILINNLKSIGNIAKFSLLGLWLMCLIGLFVVGVKQASEFSDDASIIAKEQFHITTNDTLFVSMRGNTSYSKQFGRHSNTLKPVYDEKDQKLIYSTDVSFTLKSTKDSVATLSIDKNAKGKNYQKAKMRADKINYTYQLTGNKLELDAYLTTAFENKYRDQQVEVTLFVPEGTILFIDENTYSYHRNFHYNFYYDDGDDEFLTKISKNDLFEDGLGGHYLQVFYNKIKCLDCVEDDNFKIKVDTDGIKINENGVEINGDSSNIKINDDGIKANSESVKVNINKNGIEITSD